MNFSELKTELSDRGFSYLTDTRLGRYVNFARAELDEADLWPYREASAMGQSPLAVSDLGVIESVLDLDTGCPVRPGDFGSLQNTYGDLTVMGRGGYYYIAWPAGVPTIATVPTDLSNIGVQYWKISPDLTGTQTPLAPARFHNIYVDMAVRMAYRDSDNHEAAEALGAQIERDTMRMRRALGIQQIDGPADFVRVTEAW